MKNPITPVAVKNLKPLKKNAADFVQVTRGYLSEMRKLQDKSPMALSVLLFLTERMTRQNAIVISQPTLAEILGCNPSSIYRAINLLRNENWIQVVKIGQANGYLVNSKVVWRSHQEKRYGYFNAEVIASEKEQTQTIAELENQPLREIPNVKKGEGIIFNNEKLPPPDQHDLIEPDADFVPHITNDETDLTEYEKLERLKQER